LVNARFPNCKIRSLQDLLIAQKISRFIDHEKKWQAVCLYICYIERMINGLYTRRLHNDYFKKMTLAVFR